MPADVVDPKQEDNPAKAEAKVVHTTASLAKRVATLEQEVDRILARLA